jgi:hypothetical protein
MKYLQIDSEGTITSYAQTVEGIQLDAPAGSIEIEDSVQVDLETMYWDLDTLSLETKPARPSLFYKWVNKAWVLDTEKLVAGIRITRSNLLKESDWTQMPDSPLTTEQQVAWATYRQQLRDITDNLTGSETTIEDAPWPSAP